MNLLHWNSQRCPRHGYRHLFLQSHHRCWHAMCVYSYSIIIDSNKYIFLVIMTYICCVACWMIAECLSTGGVVWHHAGHGIWLGCDFLPSFHLGHHLSDSTNPKTTPKCNHCPTSYCQWYANGDASTSSSNPPCMYSGKTSALYEHLFPFSWVNSAMWNNKIKKKWQINQ